MKKLFYLLFTIIAVSFLQSCFLFKPVQKRCPAYSINLDQNQQQVLTSHQQIKTTEKDF
jgi:hypothetical protein|tara:strand:+ start:253 stop:429 length:177 start_codon:yes stop_codon:yes gene_type:complete